MSQSLVECVSAAVAAVRAKTDLVPEIAMILGSGLGSIADEVENPVAVSYKDIPGFASSTVQGHVGELVIGKLEGHVVCIMRGRVHYYEGITMKQVTFPVRVMHALGAKTLFVTNAAGGVATRLSVGDLMVISDHINFMGTNPLIGPNEEELGPRFPAMAHAYDLDLRLKAKEVAAAQGINLQEGVYWANSGPSFETPAEVRMIGILGGDAVGMSTVPEVIVAKHAGMKVFGVSCITNVLHQGPSKDTHHEVLQAAASARPRFIRLIRGVVKAL